MKRKAVPQKLKMLLQKEIKSSCPFCTNTDVDHFQFHHIDENPSNNDIKNLLMLCPICHSKITKGDISRTEVESKKSTISISNSEESEMGNVIQFNSKVASAVVGNNNTVTVKVNKKVTKNKYPTGCIGADLNKANYIGYLVDRYHEFKKWHVGKEKMNYAIFPSKIKRKYKIGKTRTLYNIPEPKFEELALFIQKEINGTVLANVNKSKGQLKNFPSFIEYVEETNDEN